MKPGYLFVAIDGVKVNAHKFIPDTVKAGALCVVSHEDLGETDFPYILVESTGQALLDIAKLYRDSFDIKVVPAGPEKPGGILPQHPVHPCDRHLRERGKDQHQGDDCFCRLPEILRP